MRGSLRARRRRERRQREHRCYTDRVGNDHENHVLSVLQGYVAKGEIVSAERTESFSYEDCRGIDIIIVARDGAKHFLQVKSSLFHAEKFARKHPTIPVLVLTSVDQPKESIIRKLEEFFPFLRPTF